MLSLVILALSSLAQAQRPMVDPLKIDDDFAVQGEYVGNILESGEAKRLGVRVGVDQKVGEFRAIAYRGGLPGDGWDKVLTDVKNRRLSEWPGQSKDDVTSFPKFLSGSMSIRKQAMTVSSANGEKIGELRRIERQSPTLGAKPPEKALVLFDGSHLDHFVGPRSKMTEDNLLMIGARSKASFRSFDLHLEFRVPYLRSPGHSAIFLQNSYHLAIAGRSFGSGALSDLGCGGIRWVRAPDENMCFPPLTWQTLDVAYQAARFDKDKVVRKPTITVRLNGVVIHDGVELPEMPPEYRGGGTDSLTPTGGPLQLQSHADDRYYVFRNFWVLEK